MTVGLHLPPEEQQLSQRGGADANADEMKLEMEKEKKDNQYGLTIAAI